MNQNPFSQNYRPNSVALILFAILLFALPLIGGCESKQEEDKSLNGKTMDGKPLPPEAKNAPAAPGAFGEGMGPGGIKGAKGKK